MKIKLFILVLVLVIKQAGFSQTYFPFPETHAEWHYQYYDDFNNPTGMWGKIILDGDTIIGTVLYKKISGMGLASGSCIREENKIIYYYNPDSLMEYVLFDFNLGLGDTLFQPYPGNWIPPRDTVIITSIDSMLLSDNQYHKLWRAGNCSEWIEGVGALGTFFSAYDYCLMSGSPRLECFWNDTTFTFGYSWICYASVFQPSLHQNDIALFPNPSNSKITINNYLPQGINYLFQIKDISGKTIFETKGIPDQVDLENFNTGLYCILISNKENHITRKFIKY